MDTVAAEVPEPPAAHPRRVGRAVVLSLLVPGLGQLYAGRPGRALAALALASVAGGGLLAFAAFALGGPLDLVALLAVVLGIPVAIAADAGRAARRAGADYRLRWYNRWWVYVGAALVVTAVQDRVAAVVRADWIQAFRIPSRSMAPALEVGDHVLVDKRAYRVGEPRRGDVVVFRGPHDPERVMLKRVIGLPGETVELRAGTLLVDGVETPDPFATYAEPRQPDDDTMAPVRVPQNGYLLLGDNRSRSVDGRAWGAVARVELLGKVRLIYWSWADGRVAWERIGRRLD